MGGKGSKPTARSTVLTLRMEYLQSGMHSIVSLVYFVYRVLIDRLKMEGLCLFYYHDSVHEHFAGFSVKGAICCHAGVLFAVHELLHAHSNLVRSPRKQLKCSWSGNFRYFADTSALVKDTLEVVEN